MTLPPGARSMRLVKEMRMFAEKAPWGITCAPVHDDTYDLLQVTMLGPKNTPYEKGLFKLTVTLPERYPFEPPMVKFETPVYHPNIDKGGRICMDLLKMPPKGGWVPTITLDTLLISLQTLLAHPNPDDPLMMDIAAEFKYNYDSYIQNATEHTRLHAKP